MSTAARTHAQSPALHVGDSHDLIRVHGARVNNLKDVSVEIPKRRLMATVESIREECGGNVAARCTLTGERLAAYVST